MVGVGLFLTVMGFALTGYLLPWDELAFWGTVVATDATKELPLLGDYLLKFMRGGDTVSDLTLSRFFALHVSLLPMALFGLIALHMFLIRYHHISPLTRTDEPEPKPEEIRNNGGRSYFPDHFKRELLVAYGVLLLVIAFAIFTKPHLGKAANPMVTPTGIKPEWYFLPVYQSLKYVPGWLGVIGNGVFVLFLLALPLLDRNPERRLARRKFAKWAGILLVLGALVLGILGHVSDTTRTIFGKKVYFDIKGIPQVVE
jgi:quinol-cytochrome oxidoreductase complex cytochrome b subunit